MRRLSERTARTAGTPLRPFGSKTHAVRAGSDRYHEVMDCLFLARQPISATSTST